MKSLVIVDFIEEVSDAEASFRKVFVLVEIDLFVFQSLDEPLSLGIVVGITAAAHADTDALFFEKIGVDVSRILGAAI